MAFKLPPLPRQNSAPPLPRKQEQSETPPQNNPSQNEQEQQQKPSGAGRFLTEVNGVPVWVDSSRTTGKPEPSSEQTSNSPPKSKEQLSSNIKRMLGI